MTSKPRDWHGAFDRDDAYGNSKSRAVTVTTASAVVLASNPRRKMALFINDSDTVMYLSRGGPAVSGACIRLNPYGGSWMETPDTLGYYWRGEFTAICSASKSLVVIEDQ